MKQWGELFDTFVDAALDTAEEAVGREEILAHLNSGTLVPGRYMYASDLGANNWIRLCNDSMYRHHRETVEFWANSAGKEIATLVHERLGDDVDYVSLGPGAGEKDAELIGHWLNAGMDIFYYPYDISRVLVSKAITAVREGAPRTAIERLRIKAVLADFNHLSAVSEVFEHRASPNVVALLGSLGNLDNELKFLRKLKQQMSPKDILVLEVRLRSDKERPTELTDGDAALRFDFGALESYLGLRFRPELMTIKREQDISSIGDTVTTVVGCKQIKYGNSCYPEIKLLYIHQYTEEAFLAALKGVGFEVVKSMRRDRSENFLVCIVRRKEVRRGR